MALAASRGAGSHVARGRLTVPSNRPRKQPSNALAVSRRRAHGFTCRCRNARTGGRNGPSTLRAARSGARRRLAALLPRSLRRGAGGAPALARRLRPAARRGEGGRGARAPRRGPVADQARERRAGGAATETRERQADRPLRRLGQRRAVVARPDGALARAAARADDAQLAQLVCDQQRGRRLAAADDQPEPHAAAAVPRDLPADADRDDDRPGDADLPLAVRQHQGGAERELRARDAGALHARGRRRLHRGGRPRARPRTHRLDQHLEPGDRGTAGLPLRPDAARRRHQGHLRQARALRLARQPAAHARAPRPSALLRDEAVVLLLPGGAAGGRHAAPRRRSTSPPASRSGRSSRRC